LVGACERQARGFLGGALRCLACRESPSQKKKAKLSMMAIALVLVLAADLRGPSLPPLLRLNNGTSVDNQRSWLHQRRPEVLDAVQTWFLGLMPTRAPMLVASKIINKTTYASRATSTFVNLTFGISGNQTVNVSYTIELLLPPTLQLAPVFLTQWVHRAWAILGLERGYIGVVYPGSDAQDVAPLFQEVYCAVQNLCGGDAWGLIAARAWVASRTLDYVLAQVLEADPTQVCISGHSRNGKQSLVAAALDQRIGAVVGSSPGSPIASPFRFSSAQFYGEDAFITRADWWCTLPRQYVGRENDMVMDGHGILGLIAPRHAAIATAWQDREGDQVFANEMSMKAASEVYSLLGAPTGLQLLYRQGDHHGRISVTAIFDYFDACFGRNGAVSFGLPTGKSATITVPIPPQPLASSFVSPAGFDWDQWALWAASVNISRAGAPRSNRPLTERIDWLLDTSPAQLPAAFNMGDAWCEVSRL
jgi:hypothetical protein